MCYNPNILKFTKPTIKVKIHSSFIALRDIKYKSIIRFTPFENYTHYIVNHTQNFVVILLIRDLISYLKISKIEIFITNHLFYKLRVFFGKEYEANKKKKILVKYLVD